MYFPQRVSLFPVAIPEQPTEIFYKWRILETRERNSIRRSIDVLLSKVDRVIAAATRFTFCLFAESLILLLQRNWKRCLPRSSRSSAPGLLGNRIAMVQRCGIILFLVTSCIIVLCDPCHESHVYFQFRLRPQ